jgi:hypothetical protein
MLLIYSMPKLVPFALRMNGISHIGIARLTWSHLINMCGTRASAKVAGIATVFPLRARAPGRINGTVAHLLDAESVPFWDFVRPELRTLLIIACGERSARALYPSQVAGGL